MIIYHEILLGYWRELPGQLNEIYVATAADEFRSMRCDSLHLVPDDQLGAYLKEEFPVLCRCAYDAWKARSEYIRYTEI